MNINETKKFLNQAYYINKLIDASTHELAELRAFSVSIPSARLGKVHDKNRAPKDRVGEMVAKIVDLEKDIMKEIANYVRIKIQIKDLINSISDLKLRLIMQEKYLNYKEWKTLIREYDFDERNLRRLHRNALFEICEKIEKMNQMAS